MHLSKRRPLVTQISTFHIDSTYKLLRANIPLYALTGKTEHTIVFPFLYFFISPDTSENIQYCVCRYFQYINREPEMISMDCAPQIAEAIERGIPNCHILWCGVHVLRAILRKADKFKSRDNFEEFYNLMKLLVFNTKEESPEEEQNQEEENPREEPAQSHLLQAEEIEEEEQYEEEFIENEFQPSQIFLPRESSDDPNDSEFIPEEETFETSEEVPEHLTQEEAADLDAVYDRILEILSTEPKAQKYFDRQWRHHLDRWNKRYRNGGDATNNVSESHFKVLKHSYFPERRNIRLDDFVVELYTTVVPALLIKFKVQLINSDKVVRILRKANDHEQILENKKVECLKMLEAIYSSLQQGSIDSNLVYCTLKVLLKKKQLM
ncbi:hypothetical protein TVAG_177130 [Trichomonas vaginalis G3]|uniref:MULE transposase domain-containing protein n=1 Tax=Trichomonas vaginalis (strain ATCC PRA-98 / G3) TaxID=412133 RepID=A2F9U5_TRIV3|nr:hypothetical protein TVAG_177130 [Trichomonas vaginalis G3]|eukprot:XP_001311273.1 hypothetical protein [Trichomonas vaginalis G3]